MQKQTPSQTVGPFFHYGLMTQPDMNILVNDDTQGQRIFIQGQVLDGAGQPIPDALIEIWQADANGYFYHPADPNHALADPQFKGFGRTDTVKNGKFTFLTVKPGAVAYDETQLQAPHINIRIFSRGMLIHAYTRLYFSDEQTANAVDPILNLVEPDRRTTLIAQREQSEGQPTYTFNIIMQNKGETVFFDPQS
jgi:protocatechuate 3,4-dioxygenase alpha subunit